MRQLIESLTPGDRPISWTWIGGMFAFYVAVMAAAATVYVTASNACESGAKNRRHCGDRIRPAAQPAARRALSGSARVLGSE